MNTVTMSEETLDSLQAEARRVAASDARPDLAEVKRIADELRYGNRTDIVTRLLIDVARSALSGDWPPGDCVALAKLLRAHDQFEYSRRLLSRVREDSDSQELREQHALSTYKDQELREATRLDAALRILIEHTPLDRATTVETLGLAGAIYKRRWQLEARRADLEESLWCYERGFAQKHDTDRTYAGINAAFVADQLADLESRARRPGDEVERLRASAGEIRSKIVALLSGQEGEWVDATLAEAWFGLGDFAAARERLATYAANTAEVWKLQTTAMQIAALGRLLEYDHAEIESALRALLGERAGAVARASQGKVGLALSGGGFRASLFHVGVLARLAECDVLRRVEVLSCVSGGSILGAFYYLRLRDLLQSKADEDIDAADYVELVRDVATDFLDGVRENLRGQLTAAVDDNVRMVASRFSRTDRAAELFESIFYSGLDGAPPAGWQMTDLYVRPAGWSAGFSLRDQNWLREAKVPSLVLNATTLNTGHCWQFTASSMGEPPPRVEQVEAIGRLRRVYYDDLPSGVTAPSLAKAVAASACVPMLFAPITLEGIYEGKQVELVDGGVHDNQGIASLLDQDCGVMLVSDASGQMRDADRPARGLIGVAGRANTILMSRVRGEQLGDLAGRARAGTLLGAMIVHLTKGLRASPQDWIDCQERWTDLDEVTPPAATPYRIAPAVQRALAQLRTDLDAFSDDEAYALMAAGYEMTRHELAAALPQEAGAPQGDWPFTDTLARLDTPELAARLAQSLTPGSRRFFRGMSRSHGRAGRVAGALARGAVTGLRVGVATPVRAVLSLPLAVIGSAATRVYLRASAWRKG